MLSTLFAILHLLSLVLGVACLLLRRGALARAREARDLAPVLYWDNWYGLVALVWLGSGLYRAFGGIEKGTDYYLHNHVFWLKLLVLLVLLAVEGVLMVTFIRWRIALAKGRPIDLTRRPRLVTLHHVEFWVIVVVVIAASTMARGIGSVKTPSGVASANASAISLGAELYAQHCGACHQADGRGLSGKVAGDFVGDPTRLAKSDAQLLSSIAQGVPGTAMPGFSSRLDKKQQEAVLAYIRATFGQGN
ncbi:MAG: DUF2214 family protein [Polyangiaceae bacterium]|nr:DUF2214 family protein [Polyangiaceae bacterium]